jgi:hypothetical protein
VFLFVRSWRDFCDAATGECAMSEDGNAKPSIFSHVGLMTVVAAVISALAALAVAFIQKGGGAEKAPDGNLAAAANSTAAAAPGAPIYVTKLINGKMVKVLVAAPRTGAAAGGGQASAVVAATNADGRELPLREDVGSGVSMSAPTPQEVAHHAAQEAPAASADPEPAADTTEENP